MSRHNTELVRRLYSDGLFDRDPARLVRELAAEDVEYVNPPEAVEPGTRRGRDRVVAALRSSSALFDSARHEVRELFDCGDAVVAAVSFCTRSRGSGAELVQEEAHTWTFRDGKVVRFEWGRDLRVALDKAGPMLPHQAYDALNRRDLDAFLALMAADVEARPRVAAVEGGYHGHDGIRRWWAQLLAFIPDFVIETVAVREIGDVTLATLRTLGHGAGSRAPLDETFWSAAEWRARKCVWWGNYGTEAEALEAVRERRGADRN